MNADLTLAAAAIIPPYLGTLFFFLGRVLLRA